MSDYDDLRAKALVATPGPWHAEHDMGASRVVSERYYGGVTGGGLLNEDATYIAAVSPDVVLELLEHRELALAELSLFHDLYDKVVVRAEAAEAAVERVRALARRLDQRVEDSGYDPLDILSAETNREHERIGYLDGVRTVVGQVQHALDGSGAPTSVEVDSGSTDGANGAQNGCFVNGSGEPLRDYNESAFGAREGGTA